MREAVVPLIVLEVDVESLEPKVLSSMKVPRPLLLVDPKKKS
jgi:hypothetical protein